MLVGNIQFDGVEYVAVTSYNADRGVTRIAVYVGSVSPANKTDVDIDKSGMVDGPDDEKDVRNVVLSCLAAAKTRK